MQVLRTLAWEAEADVDLLLSKPLNEEGVAALISALEAKGCPGR
jgi:hypothetical protein